jgi:hypothetical protein
MCQFLDNGVAVSAGVWSSGYSLGWDLGVSIARGEHWLFLELGGPSFSLSCGFSIYMNSGRFTVIQEAKPWGHSSKITAEI